MGKYRYAYDEAFVGNKVDIPDDAIGVTVKYFDSNDRPAYHVDWVEPVEDGDA